MDKNNRNLKILHNVNAKMLIPVPCCTYHQLKYSSTNRSTTTKASHTKEPTFRKMAVYGKRGSGEWAKSRKG